MAVDYPPAVLVACTDDNSVRVAEGYRRECIHEAFAWELRVVNHPFDGSPRDRERHASGRAPHGGAK